MPRKKSSVNFEEAMSELEKLIDEMESGKLSLEESLSAYEKGIQLSRDCQNLLEKAEQKVYLLTEEGDTHLEPYSEHTEDS